MTDTLTVPTHFGDIAELAEGLADRVDEERLMLYGPEPVTDGAWVRFSVLLMDQSAALAGIGRAVASIDGGDERPDQARFDIVLDSLQLEARAEVVYERLLMVREGRLRGDPTTGQVSVEELERRAGGDELETSDDVEGAVANADSGFPDPYAETAAGVNDAESISSSAIESGSKSEPAYASLDDAQEFASGEFSLEENPQQSTPPPRPSTPPPARTSAPPARPSSPPAFGGGTADVDASELDEIPPRRPAAASPAAMPSRPPVVVDMALSTEEGRMLVRPLLDSSWSPSPVERTPPRESSGYFEYGSTEALPVPNAPPRPDLDPQYRVSPAPKPDAQMAASARRPSQLPSGETRLGSESGSFSEEEDSVRDAHAPEFEGADEEHGESNGKIEALAVTVEAKADGYLPTMIQHVDTTDPNRSIDDLDDYEVPETSGSTKLDIQNPDEQ